MGKYVGGIDQGTTSTRFVLFDHEGNEVATHQLEHEQICRQPGWCEHDPREIWERVVACVEGGMKAAGATAKDVVAVGITNQRETTVAWDKKTGEPLCNAIVWHDLRTAEIVNALAKDGGADRWRAKTGLPLSTYFSAVKMRWLMLNEPAVKAAVDQDRCAFGTVDAWLSFKLTGGADGGAFVTDVTNASRTLLMNLETLAWDQELCDFFGVPLACLPAIKSNSEVYGVVKGTALDGVKLASSMGDQQAATLGNGCVEEGQCKNTYGTGCFIFTNTGTNIVPSSAGLLTTMGFKLGPNAKPVYALEGAISSCGSTINWLRDGLGLIQEPADMDRLAGAVEDSGGVVVVPAFSGILAPHWRADARGTILGLTFHSRKEHIARAVLEGVALSVCDVMGAMKKDVATPIHEMRVDGGATQSKALMQCQADLLDIPVKKCRIREVTAFGSAFAAGLAVGFWSDSSELVRILEAKGFDEFRAAMPGGTRAALLARWEGAVKRSFELA